MGISPFHIIGVGRATNAKLKIPINTIGELAQTSPEFLKDF